MNRTRSSYISAICLTALAAAFSSAAGAETYISATIGSGPNGFSSKAFAANADLFTLPLNLNLYDFKSSSTKTDDVKQTSYGLDWDVAKPLRIGVKHNNLDDGTLKVSGNEAKMSFYLHKLWRSDLRTQLDLGYNASTYTPEVHPVGVNSGELNQKKNSVGLRQAIVSSFTVYGSHDTYEYDHNPTSIAYVLILRTRNNSNAASTLLAFPDKTNALGLNWRPTESLALDISSTKTTTLLDQEQKSNRFEADYQITDHLNVTAAVSKATSTELRGPNGKVVLLSATDDTYSEITLGWAF